MWYSPLSYHPVSENIQVRVIDSSAKAKEVEESDVTEEMMELKGYYLGFCAACFNSNPPVRIMAGPRGIESYSLLHKALCVLDFTEHPCSIEQ
jgi:hypothetical protein